MTSSPTSSQCVSNLTLDEWFAGELDSAEAARVAAHLETCKRCSTRHAVMVTQREAFLATAPSFEAHAHIARPVANPTAKRVQRLPMRAWAVTALAAAVALAIVVQVTPRVRDETSSASSATRTKGTAKLSFFVKRGERILRGETNQTVRPGDLLRFTYTSAAPTFLALVNVDARGTSTLAPQQGTQPIALPAAIDAALDFSVELDETLGEERTYAIFCPSAFDVDNVKASLMNASRPTLDASCHWELVTLHKEAEP